MAPSRARLKGVAARLAFWVWVPSIVLPGVYLMAWHLLALPQPSAHDPVLARAVVVERRAEDGARWIALHVLSADCGCSQRVLARLAARRPMAGVSERILLVGEPGDAAMRARAAGFPVEVLTGEELGARYHVEAAPLMVVADGAGVIRYVGGYTQSKQGPDIEDVAILGSLLRGEDVAALPVFGCAVSRRLQTTLDPFRLKYRPSGAP